MKKILLFFAFLGISLGLFLGIRNEMLSKSENTNLEQIASGDIYMHELNVPIIEVDSMNPILTTNKQVSGVLSLIYEPLVAIDKADNIKPCLATNWAQKDNYTWIIKLRKDVKWHGGSDFTSNDVVFTLSQIMNENNNSIYKENLRNVLSYEKLDEYSVSITLSEKDNLFIYKLLFPILPEYYFKNGGILSDYKNNTPIGTGAFKYVSTNESETVMKLEKNTDWWNESNSDKLEEIYLYKYATYGEAIKAYKSAEVDLIVTSMADWEKKFGTIGNNIYGYESSTFDTIIPNTKKLSLSDSSVRKAILTAINRENIITKVFNSNATLIDLPIHANSANYSSAYISEYSTEKARQILLNAGWEYSSNNWKKDISGTNCKLKFTMIVNENNDEHIKAAEIIKENLGDLGVPITIKKLSWSDYEKAIINDDFELALASLDIKNEMTCLELLTEENSINYANYSSIPMSEVISNVKSNDSLENMKKFLQLYKEETPYIGLYFRNGTVLTNKSVKGSIEPTWWNPYENIATWCK